MHDVFMRTTVTLEEDVAAKLRQMAHKRKISFGAALNSVLRRGLAHDRGVVKRYRLPARRMGLRQGIDLGRALSMAREVEDAELLRKREPRK